MPEEINRVVADILSFGVPVHLRTRKMTAGFEFDGKRAAGIPGVSATGGQAQPDSGTGGAGRRRASWILCELLYRRMAFR